MDEGSVGGEPEAGGGAQPDPGGGGDPEPDDTGGSDRAPPNPVPDGVIPAAAPQPTAGAEVLCVANQKGGVGKTTTAVSLGAALADLDIRILLVDLDPQGNATTGLGLRAAEGDIGAYQVLLEQVDVAEAVVSTGVDGLDCLPSSIDLAGAEVELVSLFSRELRLRRALDAVADRYDVILIDCPPSLGLLTINALAAADQALVPIQCEYYALEGLGQLLRTLDMVRDNLNDRLRVGGVVLTMFDGRTNLAQDVADDVRDYFGELVYETVIPRTVRLSEAPGFGQPITLFDPNSRGARAYMRLAHEVAARLGFEQPATSSLDRLLGAPPPGDDDAADTGASGEMPESVRDAGTGPGTHEHDEAAAAPADGDVVVLDGAPLGARGPGGTGEHADAGGGDGAPVEDRDADIAVSDEALTDGTEPGDAGADDAGADEPVGPGRATWE